MDQGPYMLFTSQAMYDLYWVVVSNGPIVVDLYRSGNIDLVGRGGIKRGLRIHGPSQPIDDPHTYPAPPAGPLSIDDPWSFAIPFVDDSRVTTLEPMLHSLQLVSFIYYVR
ncbi:hypothetical protein FRX31_024641 [Thalictrum thalictroides]|uniref:Uncharacterized protein n=1 Tax=Thalictrum thalictroides TaxID=46969 RepID=A0A7J6VLH3_THATH|nr:hypothetical protein FRX31_024641 [Thalictrum thalictroides]